MGRLFRLSSALTILLLFTACQGEGPIYKGKPAKQWAQELQDRDLATRNSARRALEEIGLEALPFVRQQARNEDASVRLIAVGLLSTYGQEASPELARAVGDKDLDVSQEAIDALVGFGDEAISALEAAADDHSVDVRVRVAHALGRLDSPESVPVLIDLLRDSKTEVVLAAMHSLERLAAYADQAVPALVALRGQQSEELARLRLRLLGSIAESPEIVVPELMSALDDSTLRIEAVQALGRFEVRAATASPMLISALQSSETQYAGAASVALGKIGLGAIPDSELAQLVAHEDASVRTRALETMTKLDSLSKVSCQRVQTAVISDPDPAVRLKALECLRGCCKPSVLDVELLGRALREDDEAPVRIAALDLLVSSEHQASVLLPLLEGCLEDEDTAVRNAALRHLGSLGIESLPSLTAITKQLTDPSTRRAAASTLIRFGPQAAPALPTLERLFNRSDYRQDISEVLVSIGSASVPSLVRSMQTSPSFMVKCDAVEVLETLGPKAATAVPALIAELNSYGSAVHYEMKSTLCSIGAPAAPALYNRMIADMLGGTPHLGDAEKSVLVDIGPGASSLVPKLIDDLRHKDLFIRYAATNILGAIGEKARPALPELKRALGDSENLVRSGADDALKRIDPMGKY